MSHRIADAYMQKLEDESEFCAAHEEWFIDSCTYCDESGTWGVWCIRSGGDLGPAETWMKNNGVKWTGTEGEAVAKARDTQDSSNKTFAVAGRRNPLVYEARSL